MTRAFSAVRASLARWTPSTLPAMTICPGRVEVHGLHHRVDAGTHALHQLALRFEHSGHGAGSHGHGLLHEEPPLPHHAHRVVEAQRAGSHVSGVLSQRVSSHDVHGQRAGFFERSQQRDGRGQDGGLRVGRERQRVRRSLEAQAAQ
jgi:hypothetical protein